MRSFANQLQQDQLVIDPYWREVIFYMKGDDYLGGVFDDQSGNVTGMTSDAGGNTAVQNSNLKFGLGNVYHAAGNGAATLSQLNIAATNNTLFQMGTRDWTVEFWIRRLTKASTSNFAFLSFNQNTSAGTHDMCLWQGTSPDTGWKHGWYNGTTFYQHPSRIAINTWTHCSACRQGTTMYLSVDGQVYNAGTNSKNMNSTAGGTKLGTNGNNENQWGFFVDDLRITKGIARYVSNFNPPEKTFPTRITT
jgi:hypothetical protein